MSCINAKNGIFMNVVVLLILLCHFDECAFISKCEQRTQKWEKAKSVYIFLGSV